MDISTKIGAVVLDISTTPISTNFQLAGDDLNERLRYAPTMLVATIYSVRSRKYRHFLPEHASNLIDILKLANELISFNGKKFDLIILKKHHNLKGRIPKTGVHIDLGEIAQEACGKWVTLNELTQLNLGEKNLSMNEFREKHGLKHDPANRTDAKAKCKFDVQQTYKLWKLYTIGQLRYPS